MRHGHCLSAPYFLLRADRLIAVTGASTARLDSAARVRAVINQAALHLSEYAFWVLASHGPGTRRPAICATCQEPWRCPDVDWAAHWVAYASRTGLLEDSGAELGDDVAAILTAWADAPVLPGTEPTDG
jgi:hypothetical protein